MKINKHTIVFVDEVLLRISKKPHLKTRPIFILKIIGSKCIVVPFTTQNYNENLKMKDIVPGVMDETQIMVSSITNFDLRGNLKYVKKFKGLNITKAQLKDIKQAIVRKLSQ